MIDGAAADWLAFYAILGVLVAACLCWCGLNWYLRGSEPEEECAHPPRPRGLARD